MAATTYRRPFPDLFRDLMTQLVTLLRMEGELARAEMSEKARQLTRAITVVIAGAVILIPALVILFEAAVAGLVEAGLESYWAALIVGGAALVVAVVLLIVGARSVQAGNLTPTRTIDNLRRDASVATDRARTDHEI